MEAIAVVGAGVAGLSAAAELRRQGWGGRLTIVGAEPYRPYRRPPLSKEYLLNGVPEPVEIARASELDVTWRLGQPALALDMGRRRVVLGGGGHATFDGLIIATGAGARSLPHGLRGLDGVLTLRSRDDADRLRVELAREPEVVVVGAGFLGNELAATARARGLRVTLVERRRFPLLRALGSELGARVAELHRAHGVDLKLGRQIAHLRGHGRVSHAVLDDGTIVRADLVLAALGSEPSVDWLSGSGLSTSNGIAVDGSGVAAPGIAAAGDVARLRHPLLGGDAVRIEHYASANDHGARAARALLGNVDPAAPLPVPSFWSHLYDWRIHAVGFTGASFAYRTVVDEPGDRFVGEFRRAGRLVGAVSNNHPAALVRYRQRLMAQMM